MVSIRKMALIIVGVMFGWFISAIMVIIMMLSSGDMMKEMMCGQGSCFEEYVEVEEQKDWYEVW